MTRAELRLQVRELTGRPPDYTRLTDAQIDAYVNEGMLKFAQETLPPALLSIVDVAVSSGTSAYVVSGAPLRVVSIALNDIPLAATTLPRLMVEAPAWQSAANGVPAQWFQMGKTAGNPGVRLYPPPNASGTAKALVLLTPDAMPSSGDIAQWDELEQEAFAYYAAWRHLQNKTEVDQAQHSDKMMANYQRLEDLYRRINSVDSYASQTSQSEAAWRTQPVQGGA